MKFAKNYNFNDAIGHHTLLYGETNTRKTYYTAKFVQFLLDNKYDPQQISILDFAPEMTTIKDLKVGGKIQDFYAQSIKCINITFEGEIIPPRLKAKNLNELCKNALQNYEKTSQILEKFNENPTDFLIINDVSIYLHLGSKKYLMKTIKSTNTFFGNSYYGSSIDSKFTSQFSLKERKSVKYIVKNIESAFKT